MLVLPDDCLISIFEKLCVKDQLMLIEVCQRFRYIIKDSLWRRKFCQLPLKVQMENRDIELLTKEEYQKLFPLIAHHLQNFTIPNTMQMAFAFRYVSRPELLYYLSFYMPKLRVLNCLDSRIHDGYMNMISKNCPNLRVLHVSSKYITGDHLTKIKTLKELNVPGCNLHAEKLVDILTNLKLKHLNIEKNKMMIKTLEKIENIDLPSVQISCSDLNIDLLKNIVRLKSLKCLTVNGLEHEEREEYNNYKIIVNEITSSVKHLKFIESTDDAIKKLTFKLEESTMEVQHKFPELNFVSQLNFPKLKELHLRNPFQWYLFFDLLMRCTLLERVYCINLSWSDFVKGLDDLITTTKIIKNREIFILHVVVDNASQNKNLMQNHLSKNTVYMTQGIVKVKFMTVDDYILKFDNES